MLFWIAMGMLSAEAVNRWLLRDGRRWAKDPVSFPLPRWSELDARGRWAILGLRTINALPVAVPVVILLISQLGS